MRADPILDWLPKRSRPLALETPDVLRLVTNPVLETRQAHWPQCAQSTGIPCPHHGFEIRLNLAHLLQRALDRTTECTDAN